MKEYISLFISIIATIVAVVGIYQTKKVIKLTSTQFLFDKRLEIINIFRAVLNVNKELVFIEIVDDEEYYSDPLEYKERSENLINIIQMEFAETTNHALFHELFNICESVGTNNFEQERIKFLLFRNTLNENISTIEYVFSNNGLQSIVADILTNYDTVLKLYSSLFFQINGINSNESIRIMLLTYQSLYREVKELKNAIKMIENTNVEAMIKEELTVF